MNLILLIKTEGFVTDTNETGHSSDHFEWAPIVGWFMEQFKFLEYKLKVYCNFVCGGGGGSCDQVQPRAHVVLVCFGNQVVFCRLQQRFDNLVDRDALHKPKSPTSQSGCAVKTHCFVFTVWSTRHCPRRLILTLPP